MLVQQQHPEEDNYRPGSRGRVSIDAVDVAAAAHLEALQREAPGPGARGTSTSMHQGGGAHHRGGHSEGLGAGLAAEEADADDAKSQIDLDTDSEPNPHHTEPGSHTIKSRRKATQRPVGSDQKRQAFSKRKRGLVLKAYQLYKLTDAKVFLFMVNDKGSTWAYSTPGFGSSLRPSFLRSVRELAALPPNLRSITEVMAHPKLDAMDSVLDDRQDHITGQERASAASERMRGGQASAQEAHRKLAHASHSSPQFHIKEQDQQDLSYGDQQQHWPSSSQGGRESQGRPGGYGVPSGLHLSVKGMSGSGQGGERQQGRLAYQQQQAAQQQVAQQAAQAQAQHRQRQEQEQQRAQAAQAQAQQRQRHEREHQLLRQQQQMQMQQQQMQQQLEVSIQGRLALQDGGASGAGGVARGRATVVMGLGGVPQQQHLDRLGSTGSTGPEDNSMQYRQYRVARGTRSRMADDVIDVGGDVSLLTQQQQQQQQQQGSRGEAPLSEGGGEARGGWRVGSKRPQHSALLGQHDDGMTQRAKHSSSTSSESLHLSQATTVQVLNQSSLQGQVVVDRNGNLYRVVQEPLIIQQYDGLPPVPLPALTVAALRDLGAGGGGGVGEPRVQVQVQVQDGGSSGSAGGGGSLYLTSGGAGGLGPGQLLVHTGGRPQELSLQQQGAEPRLMFTEGRRSGQGRPDTLSLV